MTGLEGNLGKRLASEKNTREMEPGHTPEYDVGKKTRSGAAMKKLKGKKKEGQYHLPYSENVDDLRRMFDDWAAAYGKEYSSDKEREARFLIFMSNKKYVDEQNTLSINRSCPLGLNVFGDMTFDEMPCGEIPITRYIPLQHAGMRPDLTEIGQDLLNDPELWKDFEWWAKSKDKAYKNDEERWERFQIFLSTKILIDRHFSLHRNVNAIYGLNRFSDRRDEELPFGYTVGGVNPPWHLQMPQDALINNEELKKEWNEFERWAAAHGIVYGFEGERQFRFLYFLDNKSMFGIVKSDTDFWTSSPPPRGYDWSRMDAMPSEN